MLVVLSNYLFIFAIFAGVSTVAAQSAESALPGRQEKEDQPRSFKEMLIKQRVEREKKDHDEMLKRGEEAALLTQQLDNAFQQNKGFSQKDHQKLETLERIVTKIRKELGGDDDESDETAGVTVPRPSTLQEAFDTLRDTTLKLVDELKKTSRFTISAMAIQSSNTVLKLVKFLRLRK